MNLTSAIEVRVNPSSRPAWMAEHEALYIGNELRKAGIPLFERSLEEGPRRGSLTKEVLDDGWHLYRWTASEAA